MSIPRLVRRIACIGCACRGCGNHTRFCTKETTTSFMLMTDDYWVERFRWPIREGRLARLGHPDTEHRIESRQGKARCFTNWYGSGELHGGPLPHSITGTHPDSLGRSRSSSAPGDENALKKENADHRGVPFRRTSYSTYFSGKWQF